MGKERSGWTWRVLAFGLLGGMASSWVQASYVTEVVDLQQQAVVQAQARNGQAVASLGDINGDGWLDLGVGAPGTNALFTGAGALTIYPGDGSSDRPGAGFVYRFFGDQLDEGMGAAVAGVGDVNGDGLDDFVVGSPGWDLGANQDVGRVFVHLGRNGTPDPSAELRGSQAGGRFGAAVAGAGDVNGDGYADILVGVPLFDDANRIDSGQVQIYFGGPGTQFDTTPDVTLAPTAAQSRFGSSLAGVGDFNADGFADFVVGVPNATVGQSGEGAGLLYLGSAGAFDTNADAAFESNQIGAGLGTAVVGAGDVNGDGFSDVALGAPFYDDGETNEGGVFIFHGGSAIDATVDQIVQRNIASALFGSALAAADTNGDGYADLAIGSPLMTDRSIPEFGQAFITTGSANGLGADAYPIRGSAASTTAGRFGTALAFVDYNGNGYPELFVGAPEETVGGRTAQGYSYMARSGVRLSALVDDAREGTQGGAQLGFAIATGDINRDGLGDFAVGLPNFDTGSVNVGRVELHFGVAGGFDDIPDVIINGNTAGARFGRAVAIGDFNGDTWPDLAVGAPEQVANGGEVHVFHGGPGAFDTTVDRVLSIAQVGAQYGEVVANIGDLNGDGIVELGIGAPLADIGGATNAGVAYVYAGDPAGIGAIPLVEFQGASTERRIGWSLAAAGDVNGDGFADLAIGERAAATESGGFRVLFGGAPLDTVLDQSWTGPQQGAGCSFGLSGAGDINGDGFSDLLVGCPNESVAGNPVGTVRVFHGSPTGVALATVLNGPAGTNRFGASVAGAGDLDGDGFADVVVGSPNRSQGGNTTNGGIRLYRGSATTVVDTSVQDISVPEDQAQLGVRVAMTDLNGDGFAEILGGAPGTIGTSADSGAIHVVFANALGRNGSAQQFRNATTPIDFEGDAQSAGSFFAVLDGLTTRGRERAKLQVQACPTGVPFGHATCVSSSTATWQDLGATPGTTVLVGNPGGLVDGELYYWRARLAYAPMGVTQSGITAPANPARVGPWRRMRAHADVGEIRVQDRMFRDGFE